MKKSKIESTSLAASRREFLRYATLAAGAMAAGAANAPGNASAKPSEKSERLSVTISGYKFNRVEALADGKVKVFNGITTPAEVSRVTQAEGLVLDE